ncbi:DUF6153 family protein [Streptomyces chryseus]|uniref:Secreted protein n=1 Tax=Streptomyces chryseus TaxID=68186 RepID=A0ABQ3DSR6_9ACTN|nr:DUF6153 family protein [Streptomyces chryseus]GHB13439.1 hypothetical protein GCM10010346_41260 [Streptomyces chryseus]
MSQQARPARPLGARLYVLLLPVVLGGLLAMHGLGPAAPPRPAHAVPDVRHAAPAHPRPPAGEVRAHAEHDEGGAGGHVEHADSTCAAGGTSGAPALPAPAPAGAAASELADGTGFLVAAAPGGRAPPSLSELQLLRKEAAPACPAAAAGCHAFDSHA